jgi:hypothetical protein
MPSGLPAVPSVSVKASVTGARCRQETALQNRAARASRSYAAGFAHPASAANEETTTRSPTNMTMCPA